jgi:mediator of replication checkpoint protein 1
VEKGALSKLVPVREDSLASIVENDDEDLPPLATVIGTARAAKQSTNEKTLEDKPAAQVDPKRGLKLARLGKRAMAPVSDESSDDDLEIVNELPKHLSLFDKAKGLMKQQNTDTSAIHRLKHLAHIGADDSRNARRKNGPARPSVNPQVLEAQLRLRAREQARAEQLERIAELKAKGIEVQTAEEREREQEAFENLLEKARQDAVDLRKAEKAVAKAENGGIVPSEDESEDEDYMDMSGSDEDVAVEGTGNEFVDELADDSDEGEEAEDEESQDEEMADDEVSMDPEPTGDATHVEQQQVNEHVARKPKKKRVILDDEDEDDEVAEATLPPSPSAQTPQQQEDDPFAAFNFGNAKPASSLMSPTQMFNATMQTPTQVTQQDSIDELNFFVPPSSSTRPPPTMDFSQGDSQVSVVPSSQLPPSQQVNLAWDTQAPETPVPGKARAGSELTIETPRWQPTQDDGLPATWQATIDSHGGDGPESDVEHETQATAPLRVSESPVVASKRNRLIRGKRRLIDSDDEAEEQSVPAVKDAFREMARKRNETLTAAERAEAEREAKQMMDEQAEESEDEYAGLGGDDFVAPETAEDREMIDSSHVEVNEGELAAHFAERQRVSDEAEANKLYKDLMTGGLRRKQANMFDLDEDEDDMAVRRRQMKQREEARKRKLLLQDDNVAGLAQGKQTKGKDAFLKALADDDEQDDEILDLSDGGDDEGIYSTQTDSQVSVPQGVASQPLVEVSGNKRRLEEETAQRPPAKQRRTQATAFRAPTSLTDVKESVSFLLEEPNVVDSGSNTLDMSSDSETEDATNPELAEDDNDDEEVQAELRRQNDGGFAPDRIAMPPPRMPASQRRTNTRPAVVDRLTLKRASSTSDNVPGRTAWAATGTGGFKTPSLLRRATTNNGANGANERGVSTSNGISRENSSSGVKMGGTKKSSLAYQARDAERQAIVQASAKRRAENTARIAQLRKSASSGGFGKGMTGTFE